ncbi:MAG: hypothetical protein ACOVS5_05755 [Oligoflexus sp.]
MHKGWIDFRGHRPPQSLALVGEWDFFWKQLLGPRTESWPQVDQRAETSYSWENFVDLKTGERLGPDGYATYRLRITGLPPHPDGYEIGFQSASSSTQLIAYREGQETTVTSRKAGVVSTQPDGHIPLLRPLHLEIHPETAQDVWVIVIQVANYSYSKGGLWNDVYLGPGRLISRHQELVQLEHLVASGVILCIGLAMIMIYVRKQAHRLWLLLAIFCLILASRALFSGQVLSYLFDADGPWFYRIVSFLQDAALITGPALYGLMMGKTMRSNPLQGVEGLILAAMILGILLTWPLESSVFSASTSWYRMLIGCWTVYCFLALLRAGWLDQSGPLWVRMAGVILCMALATYLLATKEPLLWTHVIQYRATHV